MQFLVEGQPITKDWIPENTGCWDEYKCFQEVAIPVEGVEGVHDLTIKAISGYGVLNLREFSLAESVPAAEAAPTADKPSTKPSLPKTNGQNGGVTVGAHYGQQAKCPDRKPVTAICSSERGRDCSGKVNELWCDSSAFEYVSGTYDTTPKVGPDWGRYAYCGDNQVAAGVCSSGGWEDCGGKSHKLWCASIDTTKMTILPEEQFKCCGYGKQCSCDTGWYATGFAASGSYADHNCPNGGKSHTGVRCQRVVCKAGYNKDGKNCPPCGPGTFSIENGSCTPCPAGQYADSEGSTECQNVHPSVNGEASVLPRDLPSFAPSIFSERNDENLPAFDNDNLNVIATDGGAGKSSTDQPSPQPSGRPIPSLQPTIHLSSDPTLQSSGIPSDLPSFAPTFHTSVSDLSSFAPSNFPSRQPRSLQPTIHPSSEPSLQLGGDKLHTFDNDELNVVCEGNQIRFAFDQTNVLLDDLMGKSIVAVLSDVYDVAGNPYEGDGNRNEIIHTFRHAVVDEHQTTVLFDVILQGICLKNGKKWQNTEPEEALRAHIAKYIGLEDQGRVDVKSSLCKQQDLHAQIEIKGTGARRLDAVEQASSMHISRKLMESTKFSNMKILKASFVLGETDAQRKKQSRLPEQLGDGPVVGRSLGQAELVEMHGMLSSLQSEMGGLQSEMSGHKEALQKIQTNVAWQSSASESAASIELKLEALLKTQEKMRQTQEKMRQAQEEFEFKERVALGILVGSFFAAVGIVIYVLAPKKHDEEDLPQIL